MLGDWIVETASGIGTSSPFNLNGAVAGDGKMAFRSQITDGAKCYYTIYGTVTGGAVKRETGFGVLSHGTPDTLTRATVLLNSDGGTSKLDFTGTVIVFCDVPALRAPYYDDSNYLSIPDRLRLLNAKTIQQKDSGGTYRDLLTLGSDDHVQLRVAGGSGKKLRVMTQDGVTELLSVDHAGNVVVASGGSLAVGSNAVVTINQFSVSSSSVTLPGGAIRKNGVSAGADGSGFATITFPVAFPTACDGVVANADSSGAAYSCTRQSFNASGAVFLITDMAGAPVAGAICRYQADGR